MTAIRSSPSGVALDIDAPLAEYGLQSAWFIDPATGNDDDAGTEDFPLASVPELNARLSGVTIEQATTVDVLGNVTDGLALSMTKFGAAGTLTIRGTKTVASSAITITTVTAVGPSSTFPWQIDTSGIDWTTAVASFGSLPLRIDFSNGNTALVTEIVDADTVIITAVGSRTAFATPVAGQSFNIVTLSTMPMPRIQAFPILLQSSTVIEFTDVSLTAGGFLQILSGPPVRFYACLMAMANSATLVVQATSTLRQVGFTPSGYNVVTGSFQLQIQGGVILGNNASGLRLQRGASIFTSAMFQAAQLLVNELAIGRGAGLHFRATANPMTLSVGGRFFNTNVALSGSNNTGVGITVASGSGFIYTAGANAKPTVTGASDTLIGTTSRTYAQIPYVDLQLNAIPPTLTTLVGGGAFMVNE